MPGANNERRPSHADVPRMEPLARLPVFLALSGKRAVIAGNTPAVAWKAELLAAAGAEVEVFADQPCEELLELVKNSAKSGHSAAADSVRSPPPCVEGLGVGVALCGTDGDQRRTTPLPTPPPQGGREQTQFAARAERASIAGTITLTRRTWQPQDLAGAAIAVGGFDDDREAQVFAAAARAAGVPVNVIDKPAHCDFAFGAIVNRSPLVIGISTDGAAPVFSQAIRAKLEAMIPRGFARWADAARRWRAAVQTSGLSFAARRRFWQLFTGFAVTHPERAPERSDFDALIAETRGQSAAAETGHVTLVGAGPGDPELLTLRAVRALASADVILIDDLVAPEILDFARREAKKMLVGKTGYGPSCKQDEINALMITLARAGKRVVRLKGGDPMIFGRAGEEIAACRRAGIAIEVVPGVTAAQGAAARLAVSLTQRREARRLQYITGHSEHGHLPEDTDWASIADPAATTVVYMPKKTIGELAARAMAAGLAPDTPAVAVASATRADEVVVAGTVTDIGGKLAAMPLPGPVLVFIGRVFEGVDAVARMEPSGPREARPDGEIRGSVRA
jgi:uroporphyrin-III C-methyltransferase / precorrin-2 dehydrogenase / sirohydrochlorin ferrochelatase